MVARRASEGFYSSRWRVGLTSTRPANLALTLVITRCYSSTPSAERLGNSAQQRKTSRFGAWPSGGKRHETGRSPVARAVRPGDLRSIAGGAVGRHRADAAAI